MNPSYLAQIMIVEDEVEIRELMALHLLRQKYYVIECGSIEEARLKIKTEKIDLLILDWMLPGASGIDFVKELRQQNFKLPILMVTAKTEAEDIVQGLDQGADDYIQKPFALQVFLARVRTLLRRSLDLKAQQDSKSGAFTEISLYGLRMNLEKHEVFLDQNELHLTPSEFKLLWNLISNLGKVLTREKLIEQIQGEGVNVTGRTVDTHIFGLRKKLTHWGDHVETIRGVGYRVNEPG